MLGYDIKLNAKESKFYNFLDKDNFTLQSILMFKVSYQNFLNVLEYEGCISNNFYDQIKDTQYALLSDTKSNVVIKVNAERNITNLYFLDIKSDLDILELSYNFPKLDKFFIKDKVREIKKVNKKEQEKKMLKSLIKKEDNLDKINYILCEIKEKRCKDIEKAKMKLLAKIDRDYHNIYGIIKGLND